MKRQNLGRSFRSAEFHASISLKFPVHSHFLVTAYGILKCFYSSYNAAICQQLRMTSYFIDVFIVTFNVVHETSWNWRLIPMLNKCILTDNFTVSILNPVTLSVCHINFLWSPITKTRHFKLGYFLYRIASWHVAKINHKNKVKIKYLSSEQGIFLTPIALRLPPYWTDFFTIYYWFLTNSNFLSNGMTVFKVPMILNIWHVDAVGTIASS